MPFSMLTCTAGVPCLSCRRSALLEQDTAQPCTADCCRFLSMQLTSQGVLQVH